MILADESATARLGAVIAGRLAAGEAVCLSGPLGAGKSTLARALVRALTTPGEDVPSPTFTLVQFYEGPRLAIAHFDLYRLTSPDEAYEIGLDEALDGEPAEATLKLKRYIERDLAADPDRAFAQAGA